MLRGGIELNIFERKNNELLLRDEESYQSYFLNVFSEQALVN